MTLRKTVEALAAQFARDVVVLVRRAPLGELLEAGRRGRGRPPGSGRHARSGGRRSRLPQLLEAVRESKDGVSAGELVAQLKISRTGLAFLVQKAMASGDIKRVGRSKVTRYVAR